MSIYIEQIEQLVVLQKVDSEMITLERILEDAPKQLRSLQEKQAYLKQQQGVIQEKVDVLLEQKGRIESEIENDTQKVKKSKNKLMMVENTKEYHAMMREMDNLEKQNRGREEEKITVAEELSRQNLELSEVNGQAKELDSELNIARQSLDARLKQAEGRLTELSSRRKDAGQAVPKPILQRYEFIRSRLKNPVIVPVAAGICSGCHIAIPPQAFIELQKGIQILSCPNCQRLIYWSEHIESETPPADDAVAAE